MIETLNYFSPVRAEIIPEKNTLHKSALGYNINIYTQEHPLTTFADIDLAIIGVPEERGSGNPGTATAPDKIREKLYRLNLPVPSVKIVDLGNLIPGKTLQDTFAGLRDVLAELMTYNLVTIVIGGSRELTRACYLAYAQTEKYINIVAADSRLDIRKPDGTPDTWLGQIILQEKNFLFNFSNIGYQTYLVAQEDINLMSQMYFDIFRLGQVRKNLRETEPIIRDTDLFAFSMSVVRQSDAPGHCDPSPNGLYGEEACQIARYAGLSDRLSTFGLFETNPLIDQAGQSTHLAAQILWFFIEGFYNRKKDYPAVPLSDYLKFTVTFNEKNQEIVFYKSPRSERWWMEIPWTKSENRKSLIISCSIEDYELACRQEIPDRWWKFWQKIT